MTKKSFVIVCAKGSSYRHLAILSHNIGLLLRNAGNAVDTEKTSGEYDLAISIGGDGTMMHTVSEFSRRGIPTIGINGGGVGFLTSGEKADWEALASRIIKGDYTIEKRIALEFSHGGRVFGPFVNDIVLQHPFAVGAFTIELGGVVLYDTLLANGVIVSTPTGSTAYNTSVGGPIVFPSSSNIVVSMIAPMRLSTRPLVLEELAYGGVLKITLAESKRERPVMVQGDAQSFATREGFARNGLVVGDSIVIRKSERPILFATFGLASYIAALNAKKGFAL